ncbi:MAG: LysM peptidoglycan-binding domain-containing protein [Aquabacterium sp.]|nr:MAG: LysM peptidoglycan-binding domain-containing protein [Aquabacterium sp.]
MEGFLLTFQRPALLAAAFALVLAGCSTTPATTGSSTPALAPVTTAQVPPPPAQPAAVNGLSQSIVTPVADDALPPEDAIGAPVDPLDSGKPVDLDNQTAKLDLWGRVRKGFALGDLDSALVREHERWYAARPDYVQRMTGRSSRYLFHIVEQVERRGMPSELALLPFIESAFNPRAMSSAKASGMWQFIPSTGRNFDLKQNLFRDDRRDVLASTEAALDYLEKLHAMFGDWYLALAAYNWGEGNVQRAIKRNQRAGLPTDYASLNMPLETRHYVPKLLAVKNIVADPKAFGLELPQVENHPYFVAVPIRRDIDVRVAASLAGMTETDFHELNPSFNKPVILAAATPQILLPYDNAERFVRSLQAHNGALATWTAWQVPKTMRCAEAAQHAGMSEAALREINRIPPKMLVKAGSTLLVPRTALRQQDVTEKLADNATMLLTPDLPPARRMSVHAGKRDTLASVARKYRVSATQLAQWNKLSPTARLARGQVLTVYVPQRATRSTAVAAKASKAVARAEKPAKATRVAKAAGTPRAGKARVVASAKSAAATKGARSRAGSRVASNNGTRIVSR